MADQKNTTANENAEKTQKTGGSFFDSAKNLRNSAAKSALEIDARGSSPDFLSGMEGGKASENNEKGGQRKSDSSTPQGGKKSDTVFPSSQIGEIVFPEPRVMVRKIRTAISKEITEAEKTAQRLGKSPIENAKELSEAVALLRKMRAFLLEIAYKTMESLRNLWMEIIAGRKIAEIV